LNTISDEYMPPGAHTVFVLEERVGGDKSLQLISRGQALKIIGSYGSLAYLKAPLTLYYYVPTEDEWYPIEVPKGTKVRLEGSRSQALPPFSSIENLLTHMGVENSPNFQKILGRFRGAQKHGKFPWVQEPYEIFSERLLKRGYVPTLELLYALNPDTFEVLENLLWSNDNFVLTG